MVPAIVLMNLMGQSSLVTTSRYMHASSERAEKAMVEMENKRVADLEKSAKTLPYPGPLEGVHGNGETRVHKGVHREGTEMAFHANS
jgi:hypothetical protein